MPPAEPRAERILVADPHDDTRALYRELFARERCAVIEAADGRDALTKALVSAPSLVLTELRLPFVDGFALCELLRRSDATAAVPILVVTAEAQPDESTRARQAGADAVILKSFEPTDLLREARALCMQVAALKLGSEEAPRAAAETRAQSKYLRAVIAPAQNIGRLERVAHLQRHCL